jgi:multidrug efflux pump subunit AcrB
VVQLPPGASLDRTEQVVRRGTDIVLGTTGIEHAATFAGLDATTFTVAPNAATIFSGLPSLYDRLRGRGPSGLAFSRPLRAGAFGVSAVARNA